MIIKFKKLDPDAIIPKYQTAGASGFDFHALEDVTLNAFTQPTLVRTGLAIELPVSNVIQLNYIHALFIGFELQIRPRSGFAIKTGVIIVNSPGTIDSDYRGEILIAMRYIPHISWETFENIHLKQFHIAAKERIAQGVVCPVAKCTIIETDKLSETGRGEGGFGSTGR